MELPRPIGASAPQDNLQRATALAFEAVARQSSEQFVWLGAQWQQSACHLPVCNDAFVVETAARRVTGPEGRDVGPHWRILALHYLAIPLRPKRLPPTLSFADLPAARSYADVYRARVLSRLCSTAGRNAATLRAAALAIGGRAAADADMVFDFDVFPRVCMRLIWHAGDDEFPPSAVLLLPSNMESYFCSEDIVVLSERLVSRLEGRPF
jgi:hypothetical protein